MSLILLALSIFTWSALQGRAAGTLSAGNTGSVSVSLLIDYGNGTLQWHNGTTVPSNWNFFNVTNLDTNGNIASIFFTSFGSHFVYIINGVGCPTIFNCSNSWSLWVLEGACWTLASVGIDQIPVSQGATVAWFFTPVATFGEIPPTGVNCLTVNIDVKPPSDPATINPSSSGTVPAAILSTADFNATTQVNRSSLTFGHTGLEHSLAFCNVEDVNGDGLPDLVCHFNTQAASFLAGDTQGILNGRTVDGTPIVGTDSIVII